MRPWRVWPEMSFTSLNHYIDMDWLYEAYRRTRKDGAPGVDGQTASAYAEHLEENLDAASVGLSADEVAELEAAA